MIFSLIERITSDLPADEFGSCFVAFRHLIIDICDVRRAATMDSAD